MFFNKSIFYKLALPVPIEFPVCMIAARAGDFGKGFAVVAQEAEQPTAASYSLNEEIKRINDIRSRPSSARELTCKVVSSFGRTEGNGASATSDESREEF